MLTTSGLRSGHDVDAYLYLQQLIHQALQAQGPVSQAPYSPVTVTNHTITSIRAEETAQEYTPPETPHPYSLLQTQAPAQDYSLAQTHPHPHTTVHVHGHYRPHVTEAFPKFTPYQGPSLYCPAQPHSVYPTIPQPYLTRAQTSSSTRSVHYRNQPSNAPNPPNTPNPVPVTDPPANTMFGGWHCEPQYAPSLSSSIAHALILIASSIVVTRHLHSTVYPPRRCLKTIHRKISRMLN